MSSGEVMETNFISQQEIVLFNAVIFLPSEAYRD